MWPPFLAVTGPTVNVAIRTVAYDDRVERLGAIFALEAFAMPFASLGKHHFSGKDRTATTWTTLTRRGFNRGSVSDRCLRCVSFTERKMERNVGGE